MGYHVRLVIHASFMKVIQSNWVSGHETRNKTYLNKPNFPISLQVRNGGFRG